MDDILDYRGKSPTKFGMEWGKSGYLVLSALNVKNGYIDKNVEAKYGSQELFQKWMGDRRLEKGDVVFTTEAPLGNVAQIPDNNDYILNQRVVAFKVNPTEINNNFLAQLLRNPSFQSRLKANASGGTAKGIGMKELAKMSTLIPQNVDEQSKIGSFFKQLDDTIVLHERKNNLLKQVKQGYLQKMFPKAGEIIPEVRFANFDGAWENRKLEDLADIVRGASPRPIQDPKWFDIKSEVGWLRIADVTKQNGRIYHLEQKISKAGQEKTRVLTKSHLLLSIAATVGKPVINYVKTGVHDGFLIFLNPLFDKEFMYQWLDMIRPEWQKYGQPGSQVNLNADLVRSKNILIPKRDEQIRIANLFEQLDRKISLHQGKLEQLKNLKLSLLQKMFT